jgi:hypothetical protein
MGFLGIVVPAEAQSFTLKISAIENVVKIGSKVRVRIELKNTSEDDISIGGGQFGKDLAALANFRVVVKDAQGEEPPLAKLGRRVFRRPNPWETFPDVVIESAVVGRLEPGNTYTTELTVSDLYDMIIPGTFTVQISYQAFYLGVPLDRGRKEEGSHEVKRTVTVTVVS